MRPGPAWTRHLAIKALSGFWVLAWCSWCWPLSDVQRDGRDDPAQGTICETIGNESGNVGPVYTLAEA
jgi:hypothetical protein